MINCSIGEQPEDDNGYFEKMTEAVFKSGFNWEVVERKWPGFQKAFANFSIREVARFEEPEIDKLLADTGIIRNYRKVMSTINNARELLVIQKEYGSFREYLNEISRENEEKICKTLNQRFSYLGPSTAMFFLRSVGKEMPVMMQQWKEEQEHRMQRKAFQLVN